MQNKSYRRGSVVLLLIFLVFCLIYNFVNLSIGYDDTSQHKTYNTRPLFNDNKTAFVFGAVGPYSSVELFKCMSALESLTKIGGWGGEAYLLIDDTTCLDPNLIRSINNPNLHIVKLTSDKAHSSKLRRKLMSSQPFERSMAVKTYILDYLRPESPATQAIWYDCDVLFVKPKCVQDMLSHSLDMITKNTPIAIPHAYHVGSFAVRKGISNAALKRWRENILEDNTESGLSNRPSIPDYASFKRLFGGSNTNDSTSYALTPHAYHDVVLSNISSVNEQTKCVIHLTNGRCRALTTEGIQYLLDNLQPRLSSLQGKRWCPSVLRRKFKNWGIKWPLCWSPSFF